MVQNQEVLRKAVLRIDCDEKKTGGTKSAKEVRTMQNQAAKRALEQGGANASVPQNQQNGSTDTGINENGEITVQYNPASIKYHASVSQNSDVKYENQKGRDYKITMVTGENSAAMSFSLVFHSRFSNDKSVQEQMERILDMLRKSPTKQVAFLWSGIQIEGRLASFSGEYDMFDASGVPVSGHMDMTIELSTKYEKTSKTLVKLDKE